MNRHSPDFDIVILGAGLAGASAAVTLGRQGRRVALVDPRPVHPPTFKAEKIEPDQANLFRRLGLMDDIVPHTTPIHSVMLGHRGRVRQLLEIEQYGAPYQDIVNAVRRQVPPAVEMHVARAVGIETGPEQQSVTLDSGARLTARLLLLATGTGGRLDAQVGVRRRTVRAHHSLCSGFDVERTDGQAFPFESLTYYADSLDDGIDYVTFFGMPGRMRVNLFSYRDPRDPWVRSLALDSRAVIARAMPDLTRVTGDWRTTSKVETRGIELYVAVPANCDGAVLLGDACQSVCPGTGTGVSKVLTDVERLCMTHVGAWLSTPGMGADKIASYYADPPKIACDRHAMETAAYRRQFSTDRSARWRIHRQKTYALMAFAGWRQRLEGATPLPNRMH